jgi:periplasmic protein CpxP/Spy
VAVVSTAAWHGPSHAHGPGGFFGGGRHGGMADADPETMGKRIEAMVGWKLAEIDASPEQKSRITTILKGAANDLAPLRGKHREARQQMMQLMSQPTIDRAQLENLRVQQMQLGETVSRRMLGAMADAAEVLTPQQRTQLMQKMQEHRGGRHGRGPHHGN